VYQCKYFKIKELVNPAFIKLFSEEQLWTFFDDRILKFADFCREKYGVITINAGNIVDAGARMQDSNTGAQYSAHKMFRALDLHIKAIDDKFTGKERINEYNKVRKELLQDSRWDFINFEDGISWLHADTYNRINRTFLP
jgi:hypothetical protein